MRSSFCPVGKTRRAFLAAAICALLTTAFSLSLHADPMPSGYFHGEMVSFEGNNDRGLLVARDQDGSEFDCSYDEKSYLELRHQRISVAKLVAGDPLEILVDRAGRPRTCYVRILHVVEPEPVPAFRRLNAGFGTATSSSISIGQRPNVERNTDTLAGIITQRNAGEITLRTRQGDRRIRLTGATRYVESGRPQSADALRANIRVSVQVTGDQTGGDPVRALQVNWGGILQIP